MRRNGSYYWIRIMDLWRVAEWFDGQWWLTGTEVPVKDHPEIEVGEEVSRG